MKLTRRQLRRIIREAQHGMPMPRGSQPPLDVPMRDSGPVPKDQLRKLADIYMNDMGMTPNEVLGTPEFMEQGITNLRQLYETFHSMSPAGKSLASSIKGKFMRMYPEAKVGIDGRGGFITVNGVKAVDMSRATGRGMSDDEIIDKMHAVYAQTQVDPDIPTADTRMDSFREVKKVKISKRQLRRIIKEAVYDRMSYDLGLSTKEGLRTPLAKLLASVARSEPAGFEPISREEKGMMLDLKEKGLVNYGLDPRGGYRGHITDLGRKGIQNI